MCARARARDDPRGEIFTRTAAAVIVVYLYY